MALEGYYGDFSAQARKNLMAKNLPKVSNVYDVLYVNVRKEMLAKNDNLIQPDLSSSSDLVRLNNLKSNIQKEIDLLESSKIFRENNLSKKDLVDTSVFLEDVATKKRNELLSKNDNLKLNLDAYDDKARSLNLSKNAKINLDIDTYDDGARGQNLSKNSNIGINIDTYDDIARSSNISNNSDSGLNIDTYDNSARNSNVSNNAPIKVNIDTYDDNARNSNVSNNSSIQINIDTYDDGARGSNLSNNAPIQVNIDTYDDNARGSNLSNNAPIQVNIDTYDDNERSSELAANTPIGINIDTYDDNARGSNLSNNAPIQVNIDTYDDDARVDNLTNNVPIGINIDTYDDDARVDNLANNVPIGINIDTYDDDARVDNLANNVPIGINIDTYDNIARISNISNNVPSFIGINTYAPAARLFQIARNIPSPFSIDRFFNYFSNFETAEQAKIFNTNNKNYFIGDNKRAYTLESTYLDYVKEFVYPNFSTEQENLNSYVREGAKSGSPVKVIPGQNKKIASINSSYRAFYDSESYLQQKSDYKEKLINLRTQALDLNVLMRRYNLGRNYYTNNTSDLVNNLTNTQSELKNIQQVIDLVSQFENSSGWLQGVFDKQNEKTNDTPENSPYYIDTLYTQNGSALKQIYSAGTAGSMMTNDTSTDIVSNTFLSGEQNINLKSEDSINGQAKKGVRKIINTIANSNISFGKNFKRNQKSFDVGLNMDETPKTVYQRYTFADPSINNLGKIPVLYFSLRNYSNNTEILFPPYIKSYSDNANADYVGHDFLGRPESVYTYSKSNRKGNISFIVLTDYAESVELGSIVQNGKITTLTETFNKNWTDSTTLTNGLPATQEIEAEILKIKKQQSSINIKINDLETNSNSKNPDETATLEKLRSEYESLSSQLAQQNANLSIQTNSGSKYFQEDIKTIKNNVDESNIITRLAAMKKELLFQPSYFSGSKVDFLNKMEFLMKLTRPAKNNSNSGFAFTKPPISHISLGSWFDSDIVVNSVSMDYSEAPWTLDGLKNNFRVQPMWATVTLDFTFIGSYGGGGTPVLSTDSGGFYSPKQDSQGDSQVAITQQVGQPASSTGGGGGGSRSFFEQNL